LFKFIQLHSNDVSFGIPMFSAPSLSTISTKFDSFNDFIFAGFGCITIFDEVSCTRKDELGLLDRSSSLPILKATQSSLITNRHKWENITHRRDNRYRWMGRIELYIAVSGWSFHVLLL
jgi:hypothetical protein